MKRKKPETVVLTSSQKEEFARLAKANIKRAYFTALGILGSHDYAMELSQEAFLRAYKNFYKFDTNKNFFTWYYKILKNLCLNNIRDRKNKKESDFLENDSVYDTGENIAESFERNEMIQKLQAALLKLNLDEREIITMREFEKLSYKEISEILSVPIGTVMSKLYYARKKLSDKLMGMV